MSALVQLINHQLFGLFLSLELNSHIPETKSHFTPQHLISAPGDLTISNLAYTISLLEWGRPTLFGHFFMFLGPCIFIYDDHISVQRDATICALYC